MRSALENMKDWLEENVKSSENQIKKEAFSDALSECNRLLNVNNQTYKVTFTWGYRNEDFKFDHVEIFQIKESDDVNKKIDIFIREACHFNSVTKKWGKANIVNIERII